MNNNNNNNNNIDTLPLEKPLLQKLITKDDIVLDIGANTGKYTMFMASIAKYVYAFEPSVYNFHQLEYNLWLHDINNSINNNKVCSFNVAVSDKTGYAYLHLCPTDNGMNRLYPSKWCKGGAVEEVKTIRIDDYYNLQNLPKKISFVKMDIEGYEFHAIRGMVQLIKRDRPTIMMEFHPPTLFEANTDPKELYNFMIDNLGYDKPYHILLNVQINSYEELFNYTNEVPAINILFYHHQNTKKT
jgi:FkbM family methyltransferase